MPGSILNADTGFPQFTGNEKTEEKLDTVVNYLYMLLEQLRYNFGNLGAENFNQNSLIDLQEMITEPVYVRLESDEGQITTLNVTTEGITTRMDKFGVTAFSTSATYQVGDYVEKDGLMYRCTTAVTTPGAWDGSHWTQTNDATMETQHSLFMQTVNGFTLQASNGSDSSTLGIYSGGVLIGSTAVIQMNGMVTFQNLAAETYSSSATYYTGDACLYAGSLYVCISETPVTGKLPTNTTYWKNTGRTQTVINGGCISTGAISSITLTSNIITGNTIDANTLTGNTISGGTITGTTINGGIFVSEKRIIYNDGMGSSWFGRMELSEGGIEFSTVSRGPNSTDYYGQYGVKFIHGKFYATCEVDQYLNINRKLVLTSAASDDDRDPLNIIGGNNLSINAEPIGSTFKKVFIGTSTYVVNNTDIGQQVEIGSYYTPTAIHACASNRSAGLSNAWEFKRDGIYYNGNLRVSAT